MIEPEDRPIIFYTDDKRTTLGIQKCRDRPERGVAQLFVLFALDHIPLKGALEFEHIALSELDQIADRSMARRLRFGDEATHKLVELARNYLSPRRDEVSVAFDLPEDSGP